MNKGRVNRAAPAWRRILWGAFLTLSWAGCADHVERTVVTCPCDRGVCCESGVCAADENSCEQATRALSSESAGRWTGYIENFAFPSGSDAIDLTLHVESDGSLAGDLILGQGPPPAPPTDPTVGWPPNWTQDQYWKPRELEGAVYHVTNLRWTALRLRFETNATEPWKPWCEMQSPFSAETASGETLWRCIPRAIWDSDGQRCWQVDDQGGVLDFVDCGQLWLCAYPDPCVCSMAGCEIATVRGSVFDIALRGDQGDGSVWDKEPGSPVPPHNVRLIRASHQGQ